jgi:hypothetical protein
MAKLQNGTRIYGSATVDGNLTVTSGNILLNGQLAVSQVNSMLFALAF